jgi:uncharacterized protein (AIM24 family)
MSNPFSNLGAAVISRNGFDVLECTLQPGASLLTNQDTMCHMEGGIDTKVTSGSAGVGGMFRRAMTGSSFFQNSVINSTGTPRKIVLSPLMQGSIVEIILQPGESWRFADKTFLACSPNLQVSGNLNIFRNFLTSLVTGNMTYVTVTATTDVGIVWVSGYGGVEKHEVHMGVNSVPLLINNGCFLGMLSTKENVDYFKDYAHISTPGGFFSAFMTNIGFVMKIGEPNPAAPVRPGEIVCTVYTQSLNPHTFEKYIRGIAEDVVSSHSSHSAAPARTSFLDGAISIATSGRRRTRRINRQKR